MMLRRIDIPEYHVWLYMKGRCCNPNATMYQYYGGRGIKICKKWLNSFETFFQDMGPRPSPKHTLDRINVDGHYTPRNCKWSTRKEQARNRKTTRWVFWKGRQMSLAEACEIEDMPTGVVQPRLAYGWPLKKALTEPSRGRNFLSAKQIKSVLKRYQRGGESFRSLGKEFGCSYGQIRNIIQRSLSL